MDDRTIPKTGQSYAYCSAGTHELCRGFSSQRQSKMLKSHQNLGFGRSAPPVAEPEPVAEAVSVQTGHEQTNPFKLSLTHLHSSSDHMEWNALIIEPATPSEDTHGSSKT